MVIDRNSQTDCNGVRSTSVRYGSVSDLWPTVNYRPEADMGIEAITATLSGAGRAVCARNTRQENAFFTAESINPSRLRADSTASVASVTEQQKTSPNGASLSRCSARILCESDSTSATPSV